MPTVDASLGPQPDAAVGPQTDDARLAPPPDEDRPDALRPNGGTADLGGGVTGDDAMPPASEETGTDKVVGQGSACGISNRPRAVPLPFLLLLAGLLRPRRAGR